MTCLIVVAHPDDEVLGAGGIIYNESRKGNEADVCVLCGEAKARSKRPDDSELSSDLYESGKILGVNRVFTADFPNIEFNTVPHLKLVQFIEKCILETKAEKLITHHPADTNNDHLHTSLACQAAFRMFQRRNDTAPVKELLFMEVPSSTEWCVNTAMNPFRANTYIEIGKEGLQKKLDALAQYRGVMREYPHPRSDEAIRALAAYRGAQSGCDYAEAFECVFRRVTSKK